MVRREVKRREVVASVKQEQGAGAMVVKVEEGSSGSVKHEQQGTTLVKVEEGSGSLPQGDEVEKKIRVVERKPRTRRKHLLETARSAKRCHKVRRLEASLRPTPEECRAATAALLALHGDPQVHEGTTVLDSLVRTILSQNTTDKTSKVAFERLKAALPTWQSVLDAPPGLAEEAVRCGGLAEVKMDRIRAILLDERCRASSDAEPSLEWLHDRSDAQVKATLSSFKGVGPKTVACVMMFTLQRPEFPVDTHVLHIAQRLHWLPASASREDAYEHLNQRVPDDLKLPLHVLLVEHGKSCRACAKNGRLQKAPIKGPCPLPAL